ncbi:MAG: hypothetical protein NVV82_16830 [Sporocytophaga sp.]|nr:hypothetical protein [Sporocytophaga sp.]
MNKGLAVNTIKAESVKRKAERKREGIKVKSKGLSYECRLVDQYNKSYKRKAESKRIKVESIKTLSFYLSTLNLSNGSFTCIF